MRMYLAECLDRERQNAKVCSCFKNKQKKAAAIDALPEIELPMDEPGMFTGAELLGRSPEDISPDIEFSNPCILSRLACSSGGEGEEKE